MNDLMPGQMKPLSSSRLLQKLAGQDVSAKTYTAINAATQDAVKIQGRAGGTSGYAVTLTPTTLTASRTITLPDLTGTAVVSGAGQSVSLASLNLGTDPNPGGYELLRVGGQIRLSWSGANPYSNDAAGLRVSGTNGGMITLENGAVGSWTIWGQNVSNDLFIGNGATGGSRTNRMIIDGYGNVGIGGAPVNGNGKLQLGTGTTSADGIAFGTDCFMFRVGSDTVRRSHSQTRYRSDLRINSSGMLVNCYDDTGATYMPVRIDASTITLATGSGPTAALTIDTSQNTDHAGNCGVASGKVYKVNGTQVVSARRTGWAAQTATASRADLGASPTVGAIASFLRALYDDLAAHGLIGA